VRGGEVYIREEAVSIHPPLGFPETPTPGWEWGMGVWNELEREELELETSPYFFDHHDIPSRSRLMEINFRTSPEINFRPRSFLLTYGRHLGYPPCPTVRIGLAAMVIQVTQRVANR
jgi:hypothetical protein